jgi:hypothetical protein
MSLINLSVKHGLSQDEARARLEAAVSDACSKFGSMIQRVDWAEDRGSVKITGTGFTAELRVDAVEVHASADLPFLTGFLRNTLTTGLKGILARNFPQLPNAAGSQRS